MNHAFVVVSIAVAAVLLLFSVFVVPVSSTSIPASEALRPFAGTVQRVSPQAKRRGPSREPVPTPTPNACDVEYGILADEYTDEYTRGDS